MLSNTKVTLIAASLFLASGVCALTPEEKAQGFEPLFPGGIFSVPDWNCFGYDSVPRPPPCADTEGWKSFPDSDQVGTKPIASSLLSVRRWRDFDARFEYNADAYSGAFFYRVVDSTTEHPGRNLAYMLYDFRVDNPGSQFMVLAAKPDTLAFPPPERGWIAARVVVEGDRIRHWCDGQLVLDRSILSKGFRDSVFLPNSRTADPSIPWNGDHPIMKAAPIGWLATWGGPHRIRDFRIASLPLKPVALARPRASAPRLRFDRGDPTRIRVERFEAIYDAAGRKCGVPAVQIP